MALCDVLREAASDLGSTGGRVSLVPRIARTGPQELNELLENAHHAVLAVWHDTLPDERALVFLGAREKVGEQRIRADLIHQLFPRATLLMERHRKVSSCNVEFSRLSIEVSNQGEYVGWTSPWPKARLVLSKRCWDELLPPDFLSRFEKTVSALEQIVGQRPERNWHHVVDAGRTLREEFASWLHFCRSCAADNAASCKAENGLRTVVKQIADWKQVGMRRKREFPGISQDYFPGEEITWFVDSESIDDFLCLLQALRCYMGDNRHLVSWLYKGHAPHQALGVLGIASDVQPQPRLDGFDEKKILKDVYSHAFLQKMDAARSEQGRGTGRGKTRLPDAIRKKLEKWMQGTQKLDTACASGLVDLAMELAEKHCVHEGRPLHYRLVYASSASLWPEIEEVLSFEAGNFPPSGIDQTPENQAKLLDTHWSIFQPERVFAVVDSLTRDPPGRLRIQRVVRVRSPENWSGLEAEAMDGLAGAAHPCLVVVVLRQWMVRLSFSKDGRAQSMVWDVREQQPKQEIRVEDLANDLTDTVGVEELEKARVRNVLRTVLAEVSEATGEGALFIAVGKGDVQGIVKRTCMEMDSPERQMAWRRDKQLRWVDRMLLRAMFILDGATDDRAAWFDRNGYPPQARRLPRHYLSGAPRHKLLGHLQANRSSGWLYVSKGALQRSCEYA